MGFKIQERLEVSIYFDDVEIIIDAMNILNYIHIGTSLSVRIPTISLSIYDTTQMLSKINLARDATVIKIVLITAGSKEEKVYPFRLFSSRKTAQPGGHTWDIDGYYDVPLYWLGSATKLYKGTSDYALAQLFTECGIKYKGTPTSDAQVWSGQYRRFSDFASYIARRGYVNDSSAMALGINLDGEARYINANVEQPPVLTFSNKQYVEGQFPIFDYQPISDSGYANLIGGYESKLYRQSIFKPEVIDSLTVTPSAPMPEFNEDIKALIQTGPPKFSAIDVGNSETSERAVYQNTRFSCLFNTGLNIITTEISPDVSIGDWVVTAITLDDKTPDEAVSGSAIITAHALHITGANYSERFMCRRQGIFPVVGGVAEDYQT